MWNLKKDRWNAAVGLLDFYHGSDLTATLVGVACTVLLGGSAQDLINHPSVCSGLA